MSNPLLSRSTGVASPVRRSSCLVPGGCRWGGGRRRSLAPVAAAPPRLIERLLAEVAQLREPS